MTITSAALSPGTPCPDCQAAGQTGKLYAYDAGCLIRLEGQPLVTGKRYQLSGARCHLCSACFKPEVPAAIKEAPKFSPSAISNIALGHYANGLPFHRIEQWQRNCGVPLPDATQYDEMKKLSQQVAPIAACLRRLSANSTLFHYDDTPLQILSHPKAHGTAIVSQTGDRWIVLFCASSLVAGKEASKVLQARTSNEAFVTMTDASRQNELSDVDETLLSRAIIAYCLVHARRKFYDLLEDFPAECQFVVETIARIYQHEAHCKREKLNPRQRLAYHQQYSAPLMEALNTYLTNLWQYEGVEHNSTLGSAIRYLLRRWSALTRFLTVEGCPLDNSICERAIKYLIRYRKNSLFYRTLAGAQCGDTLMSLIYTAMKNGINAFDYLNALQENAQAVALNPEGFLPWHYQATLATMNPAKAA